VGIFFHEGKHTKKKEKADGQRKDFLERAEGEGEESFCMRRRIQFAIISPFIQPDSSFAKFLVLDGIRNSKGKKKENFTHVRKVADRAPGRSR